MFGWFRRRRGVRTPASQHFTVEQMKLLRRVRDVALRWNRVVRLPKLGWTVVPDTMLVEWLANGWSFREGYELTRDNEDQLDGRFVFVYTKPVKVPVDVR